MDSQRLRNLTTGRLHTEMAHIYEDIATLTGIDGAMTHQLPRIVKAMEPWLRASIPFPRFWDGKHDPTHFGDYYVPQMDDRARKLMLDHFAVLPSPLADLKPEQVITVKVG